MIREGRLSFHSLEFEDRDIYRALGYRENVPERNILDLIVQIQDDVGKVCVPSYAYQVLEAKLLPKDHIKVRDVQFVPGKIIGSYLPGMTHIALFVVTAGKEYDGYLAELKIQGDIVKEYIADAIGSVIAEACVTFVGKELEALYPFRQTLPCSPGYCGWHIREQAKLFSLFPDGICGVKLSESFLMSPIKSVSGFFGLGKDLLPQPYHCEICTNKNCYNRKQ